MRHFLIFISSLLFGATAFATGLTLDSIAGASSYSTSGSVTHVFGATAGAACLTAGSRATCDGCKTTLACAGGSSADQAPLCSCTQARIYNDLIITVRVKRPSGDKGPIRAFVTGATGTASELTYIDPPSPKNSFVTFTWSDICSRLSAGSSCEGLNGEVPVTVYSDKDLSNSYSGRENKTELIFKLVHPGPNLNIFGDPAKIGVGSFIPFRTDKGILLGNLQVDSAFPNLYYGSKVKAVRFMASKKNMDTATINEAAVIGDLTVKADGTGFTKDTVTGLINGQLYFIRAALLDEAGNLIQYFPDMKTLKQSNPECFGPNARLSCPYAVIPQKM